MIRVVVPGRPVPAARMTQRGKFVRPNAQRYMAYREEIALRARLAMQGQLPIAGAVVVTARFYVADKARPILSHTERRVRVGDVDNLTKAALDGCNGVIFDDDALVVEIHAYRMLVERGSDQRTEIEVEEVHDVAG